MLYKVARKKKFKEEIYFQGIIIIIFIIINLA